MEDNLAEDFVLGIDLGSNSVGWSIIRLADDEPCGIILQGSRVFDAAYENYMQGDKEQTANVNRRIARSRRRQTNRRRRRHIKLWRLLQRFSLLPPTENVPIPFRKSPAWGTDSSPTDRDRLFGDIRQDYFNWLDDTIRSSPWFLSKRGTGTSPEPDQTLPYILRAAALHEELEPYHLGRALYHLAQHRGFLSNRVRPVKENEKEGIVAREIGDLRARMGADNAETLGHFFAGRSPVSQPLGEKERIRKSRTERKMYKDEFALIWQGQQRYHPDLLTEDHRKQVAAVVFYQRRSRPRPSSIGWCELERECRRARAHLLIAQKFRLLQKVNDLTIRFFGEPQRYLTREERTTLIRELELRGNLEFKKVRERLHLKTSHRFNLQAGGEEKMPGNSTAAQLYRVFKEQWLSFSDDLKDKLVADVHSILSVPDEDDRKRRATLYLKKYGFESAGEDLARSTLEGGHMGLSLAALKKIVPFLERGVQVGAITPDYCYLSDGTIRQLHERLDQGLSYQDARRGLLPETRAASEVFPFLPPVKEAVRSLLNPVVMRVLTEMRKVTNDIVKAYGRPQRIYIELARDLKKSKKQREQMAKGMRANESARRKATELIKGRTGNPHPSDEDIRKVLLFDECGGRCPYCLHTISEREFLGSGTEIDHIIPRSLVLDKSFVNVVLCHTGCNSAKGDRTPFQAFAGDMYTPMLSAVRKFSGKKWIIEEKLRRFRMDDEKLKKFREDFNSRQLNDTAYASRSAADYLGLLYGGRVDSDGKQRVFTTTGKYTSYLRNIWNLNSVLKDGETTHGGWEPKERGDYRHHAVDALVIALTTPRLIDRLMEAVRRAQSEGHRRVRLDEPWPGFLEEVHARKKDIGISHRVSKKISGPLHKENFYWVPKRDRKPGMSIGEGRIRKPVDQNMTRDLAEKIPDDARAVRDTVLKKLDELGGDAKKFRDPNNLPFLESKDGRSTPIKRVRIGDTIKTFTFGEGQKSRSVRPAGNHHLEIYSVTDSQGNENTWKAECVNMIEAYRRLKDKEPVIRQQDSKGNKLKLSIAPTETLRCDGKHGGKPLKGLFVVKSISQEEKSHSIKIEMIDVNDARPQHKVKKAHGRITKSPNELRKLNARKVIVSPIGEVTEAHD